MNGQELKRFVEENPQLVMVTKRKMSVSSLCDISRIDVLFLSYIGMHYF